MEYKKSTKIGAAWIKESKSGLKYMSVKYNNDAFGAIFKVKEKKSANSPDYEIFMDEDAAEALGLMSDYKPAVEKQFVAEVQEEINVDDIPF